MWYNNRNAAIVRLDRLTQRRKFGKGAISILRIWYNHTMCGENLTTKTVLQDLPGPLLAWYRANARDLPWRRTTDPYQIWVSEIMLQQTRVAAVLGYYARFLETFPTVEALAAAPEERLMKLWEGLGYYSRARNLQKAARIVAEQGGRFPDTYQDLLALPGVGDYTASAIASAAFGRREAAVDGNVLRVVMRLTDCRDDIADPKVKRPCGHRSRPSCRRLRRISASSIRPPWSWGPRSAHPTARPGVWSVRPWPSARAAFGARQRICQ